MTDKKLSKDERQAELTKYRSLVLATLDYYIDLYEAHQHLLLKSADFDTSEHFKGLKLQTEEQYQKGRLTKLKQWFRDLTEMQVEEGDLKFNKYLQDKTGYDVDIFKSYFQRVDKVVEKGKITTDNQFYDIRILVDQLCQTEPVDHKKIEGLNQLLRDYEQRKSRQIKKPTA